MDRLVEAELKRCLEAPGCPLCRVGQEVSAGEVPDQLRWIVEDHRQRRKIAMADQERTPARRPKPQGEEAAPDPKVAEKGKDLKKGLDKVLEEIDTVLEQNAEEFVKNYVQRGGE